MKRVFYLIVAVGVVISITHFNNNSTESVERNTTDRKFSKVKFDSPDEYFNYHQGIRTREGAVSPDYPSNYRFVELNKQRTKNRRSRKMPTPGVIQFTERGPSNVPGRTRALLVMPTDISQNTWLAGSAGGGIWKTTNAGQTWTNLTPNAPTLAISSIALSESDPSIIYAGTGESSPNLDAIRGEGILKSVDSGDTWQQLASTTNTDDFGAIGRIIVDPNDANTLVISTISNLNDRERSSSIKKSTDGGQTWTDVYASSRRIPQVIMSPGNFNVQYAAINNYGVIKSIDAGETWADANENMDPTGRTEIAISPVNPNRLFASSEGAKSGVNSDLYTSDDGGATWNLVNVEFSAVVDFLGGQGWYDNTIICHPYDEDIIYFGGVALFKLNLGSSTTAVGFNELESSDGFVEFVNYGASDVGGTLEVGSEANESTLELRFGDGISQFAHRFSVPENGGTNGNGGPGVPANEYSFQDYVSVPFEVWEVDQFGNDVRQLMVSFRDQQRDGEFNLNPRDDANDPDLLTAREYIFIHNIDYSILAAPSVSVNGGHEITVMYDFWPLLAPGRTWDKDNLPESTINIGYQEITKLAATTDPVADVYSAFNGINSDVHPDQHFTLTLKEDEANETFRILLGNDGGVYITQTSDDPSVENNSWLARGTGYNTTQFYGADKMAGAERYLGGTQDNGTWYSASTASATTAYEGAFGGDGFEVLWHPLDPNKMIGGYQFNGIVRTTNGGTTWVNAISGLPAGTGRDGSVHPFITRLAHSKTLPDVIYAVSTQGVHKSENFGSTWQTTEINSNWGVSSFMDVEVSRANSNIVWAGTGIGSGLSINVSTDQAETFTPASGYNEAVLGRLSGLYSHPTQPNTAYALFSFSKGPKVLRTTDLGATWEDISGFGGNSVSSNGFPDVAVYSLYVRTDNPDIIWVGSEIGIIESFDNGETWSLNEEFTAISVWDMKGQDDEIVLATHGRGIWTATVEAEQAAIAPARINQVYQTPEDELMIDLEYPNDYDSIKIIASGLEVYSGGAKTAGTSEVVQGNRQSAGQLNFTSIAYLNGAPVQSGEVTFGLFDVGASQTGFGAQFSSGVDFYNDGLEIADLEDNPALQSPHNYENNTELISVVKTPIVVNADNPMITYRDIALVEPTNDYVTVEGTTDGLNWVEIARYDAASNVAWEIAYNNGDTPDASLYVDQSFDLTNAFSNGDLILIRFRLSANESVNAWGWAVDDLVIQSIPTSVNNRKVDLGIHVYPVPVSDGYLNVSASYPISGANIQILDLTGKTVFTSRINNNTNTLKLATNGLQNGIYSLRIETTSGHFDVQRIIILN